MYYTTTGWMMWNWEVNNFFLSFTFFFVVTVVFFHFNSGAMYIISSVLSVFQLFFCYFSCSVFCCSFKIITCSFIVSAVFSGQFSEFLYFQLFFFNFIYFYKSNWCFILFHNFLYNISCFFIVRNYFVIPNVLFIYTAVLFKFDLVFLVTDVFIVKAVYCLYLSCFLQFKLFFIISVFIIKTFFFYFI